MQHQRFDGVIEPGNGTACQCGLGFGQGVNLLARVPGLALAQGGRWCVERNIEFFGAHARAGHLWLVVGREHAL